MTDEERAYRAKEAESKAYAEARRALQQIDTRDGVGGSVGGYAGGRQSGKNALLDAVRMLRHRADTLEALAKAIPDNFPPDADAGLWELVTAARR